MIGIVTQNDDPDASAACASSTRRSATTPRAGGRASPRPAAGKDRGLLMMPVVGDEVLVAFEHGDVHKPYVLGSLWNGKDKPGDLVQTDGSFALASDKHDQRRAAKDAITIKSEKDFTLETDGKITAEGDRRRSRSRAVRSVTVKAGTSLTIEGRDGHHDQGGAAKVTLEAAGMVQVSGTQIMLG